MSSVRDLLIESYMVNRSNRLRNFSTGLGLGYIVHNSNNFDVPLVCVLPTALIDYQIYEINNLIMNYDKSKSFRK